jgi:hypothetical protein
VVGVSRRAGRRFAVYVVTIVGLAMLATSAGFVGTAAAADTTAPDCSGVSYADGDNDGKLDVDSVDRLQCIENEGLGNDYELTSDINASGTSEWNGGNGFDPIGSSGSPFTGTFDGDGHTISGLTIKRGGTDSVGLFGFTSGSTVEKVGLVDASITGHDNTGGLVGQNSDNAVVRESFVSGTVSGDRRVGGVVGDNNYVSGSAATIEDSYSLADVTGSQIVGGVVGRERMAPPEISGTVKRTYAAGDTTVTSGTYDGGIAGRNEGGEVKDSYWDKGTTNENDAIGDDIGGQSSNLNGYGSTSDTSPASEMQGSSAESNIGALDFSSTWTTVQSSDGDTIGNGYPILQSVDRQAQLEAQNVNAYAGGDGTSGTPYEIANWYHLDNVSRNLGSEFILTAGLDSNTAGYDDVASSSANGGNGFDPIGDDSSRFTGTFNGTGHTISNLSIDRGGTFDVGLFGYVNGGTIENVGVENADITGKERVGGLVGKNFGTVSNSYAKWAASSGSISATRLRPTRPAMSPGRATTWAASSGPTLATRVGPTRPAMSPEPE